MTKLTRALAFTCLLCACSRAPQNQAPAPAAPAALELARARQPEVAPTQPAAESPDEALYFGAFSEAEVKRAAARSGDDARVSWRIRPWSGRTDTLLALSFVALNADDTVMSAT